MEETKYPIFELYGPPCPNDNCDGVLTQWISMKENKCWKSCSRCLQKFEIKKTSNMLEQSIEVIEKVLLGIDE